MVGRNGICHSALLQTSPIESELTSSARFIGSPPPSGLRRDDNGNHTLDGSQRRRESVSGTSESSGEEERTVYLPANPALEMSQPRITLNTAPRNGSPPPPHAIVSAEVDECSFYMCNGCVWVKIL